MDIRDPYFVSGVLGAKICWRRCNQTTEPWDKLWHVKYVEEKPFCDLILFNEEKLGSHMDECQK